MNLNESTDFTTEYRGMTDEQLLGIAGEGELVDDAQEALRLEMRNRKLSPEMVHSYRSEIDRYKLAMKAEAPNVSRSFFTLGFTLYGRAYLSEEDEARGIQVRTKWFTLRGLPIIPIASYRYSCHDETTGLIQWEAEKVIDQVPLNWNQVIRTWLKSTALFILGIALTLLYLRWNDRSHRG